MGLGFDIYNLYEGETRDLLKLGLIGSVLLIYFIYKFYQKSTIIHKKKSLKVLSLILAFFMIFGNSFMCVGSTTLIFKNIGYFLLSLIMYIGYYYLFLVLISYLFRFLDKNNFSEENKEKKGNKFVATFKKHPFLFSLCFIVICWLPYIISYYPIILSPDPSFQIRQFFGIRTKYADYAILLDENVVMTNHHPVTHTVLLGGCLKLGTMIGNDNLGLFFYSIIQISVLANVLAFSIYYMQKMGLKTKYLIGVLLIYALVPMFPLYAMSGVKDVLFGAFIFLYFIFLHNLVKTKCEGYKWWNYLLIIILLILICLFRNNGIHVLVLSLPFTLIIACKKWKQLLTVMVCVFGFYGVFDKVILPYYKITPGSVREMLSVPFQQTARLAKYHGDEFTEEEIATIDKILGYDDLAERYDPELADPVKNEFNKYATDEELLNYFDVWFKMFFKHPLTYINATISNIYGYFYPATYDWYVYTKLNEKLPEAGYDYHFISELEPLRDFIRGYSTVFKYIPVIKLTVNCGFYTWSYLLFIVVLILQKKSKYIILLTPALSLILMNLAGPANTYFRYVLPYAVTIFTVLPLILLQINKNFSNKDLHNKNFQL